MYGIWEYKATDEEIAKCKGDYIGCEICCNVKRCINIKLKEISEERQKNA